jgi:hypothetical protein
MIVVVAEDHGASERAIASRGGGDAGVGRDAPMYIPAAAAPTAAVLRHIHTEEAPE